MKRLLSALLLAGSMTIAACGASEPDPTPSACLGGPDTYLAALEGAPQQALLEGSAPISACLVRDQSAGELNTIGGAVTTAATELNRQAQKQPTGRSALQLGYLVGAIEAGASSTGGIHTDLVRRVNSAARFSNDPDGLPAGFERTFGTGYVAARGAG